MALLALAAFTAGLWAEQVGDWEYRIETAECRRYAVITAYMGIDNRLDIPGAIRGMPVIIGHWAFAGCSGLAAETARGYPGVGFGGGVFGE